MDSISLEILHELESLSDVLTERNSRVRELCIDIIAKTNDVEITARAKEILRIFENHFK